MQMSDQENTSKEKASLGNKLSKLFYSQKAFNRRKYPRFGVSPAFFCALDYALGDQQMKGYAQVINVSKGGALVVTDRQRIDPGTKIEITFRLPLQDSVFSVDAEIVRSHQIKPHMWNCCGLKFLDNNQQSVGVLLGHLLKEHK